MSFRLGRFGPRSFVRLFTLRIISLPLTGICAALIFLSTTLLHAGVIRGTVTDTSGATVTGATVILMNGAKYVSKTVSTADGSFQFTTGQAGRFSLIITAQSFRQLDVPAFYAAVSDSV